MKLKKIICALCLVVSSFSFTSCQNNNGPLIEKDSLIGLPNHDYILNINNKNNEQLTIQPSDYSLMQYSVLSPTSLKVNLLKEGKGYLDISTSSKKKKRLSIEALDLKILNTEEHIDVNNSIDIQLSHDVNATMSLSNDVAKLEGKTITVLKEGSFTLNVNYGDIAIEKVFDSYKRTNVINSLERDSFYVRYYGRNVHQNGEVIMNNIGSGFEVTFYGTSLYASLDAWWGSWYGYTRVSIMIDGNEDTTKNILTLNHGSKTSEYTIAKGLTEGMHTVKLLKSTEALSTSMTLHSLRTDGYFKGANKDEKLKIEAYGDSITAGYGNLRGSLSDTTSSEYQSGLQTYATYAAQALKAEINVQARSGIGLYTAANIDDSLQVNSGYYYTNYDQLYEWNLNNYTPDIVIINLGTNDHWNTSSFNKDTFVTEYVKLVHALAKVYGTQTSFILLSGLMEQKVDSYLQEVENRLSTSGLENAIYRHQFAQCNSGHPLFEEHLKASEELVTLIKENNLDTIHTKTKEEKTYSDIQNQDVVYTLFVELKDVLPSHVKLYVRGLKDNNLELSAIDSFNYSLTLSLKEKDYQISFVLNDDMAYQEVNQANHTLHVRKDNSTDKLILNSFVNVPENKNPYADTFGWHQSSALFETSFTAKDNQNVQLTNKTNWLAAFVTRKAELVNDYSISTIIQTAEFSDKTNTYIGVLPYYLDDQNFIVCYLQFLSDGKLKSVGCTGMNEGHDIGWNDFWNFANMEVDLENGVLFNVERHNRNLTISINDVVETKKFTTMNEGTKEIGVWNIGANPVNYSSFTQVHKDNTIIEEKWSLTSALYDVNYKIKADNSIEYTNKNWMAGFVICDAPAVDNYYFEAKIQSEKDGYQLSDDKFIGFVAFYTDSSNYVVIYLQWNEQNKLKSIGMTGLINGHDLSWHDFWNFAGVETHLSKGDTLRIERKDNKFTVVFGGTKETQSLSQLSGLSSSSVGLWCCNTSATYSDINYGVL